MAARLFLTKIREVVGMLNIVFTKLGSDINSGVVVCVNGFMGSVLSMLGFAI